MAAKLCPRCGTLFQSVKSATCPQCFAILERIEDETAQELVAEKAKEENSEEFQAVKKAEDEQWAEQSFRACLGVVGITILTIIASIVILVAAVHHQKYTKSAAIAPVAHSAQPVTTNGPSSAALPDELLPAQTGAFTRTAIESDLSLPGATDSIDHATYLYSGRTFDVFVIRETSMQADAKAFNVGCGMAAREGAKCARPIVQLATTNWTFAVIGDTQPDGSVEASTLLNALTKGPNF
jgi:uncharacterized Zn finger protein (UPF0148 family)